MPEKPLNAAEAFAAALDAVDAAPAGSDLSHCSLGRLKVEPFGWYWSVRFYSSAGSTASAKTGPSKEQRRMRAIELLLVDLKKQWCWLDRSEVMPEEVSARDL